MRVWLILFLIVAWLIPKPLSSKKYELTPEERVTIIRGLTAEFATAKVLVPRSKKYLKIAQDGSWDKMQWEDMRMEYGPAARPGDQVQLTKVELEDKRIKLDLNGGFASGPKWYERIQIGMGTGGGVRTTPASTSQNVAAAGTRLVIEFPDGVPPLDPKEVKKILSSVLDFEKRSAGEQYVENLPPEIKKAVQEKRAIEGMDKEQVLLALGRPVHKVRETKDGEEYEDWIYGQPPGRIVFVTFNSENKVVQVKEEYAGLGGSQVKTKPVL